MKNLTLIIYISFGLFIAYLVLFFLVSRIRQRKNRLKVSIVALSHVKIALRDLKLARSQISQTNGQEFSKLLASALKTYVNGRYGICTEEATTDEIVNSLLSNPTYDWGLVSSLAEILKFSDSVKFSKRKISIPQQRGMYKKSCRFIISSERFFYFLKKENRFTKKTFTNF